MSCAARGHAGPLPARLRTVLGVEADHGEIIAWAYAWINVTTGD